jgi:MFS family permease
MGRGRSQTLRAFGAVFANADLRRVSMAYLLFGLAEWGTWVAILVFAYGQGGAAETGLAAVVQLVPAAVVAPLASVLGDRMRRDRALLLGYAILTVTTAGAASAMLLDAPVPVVYGFAALVAAGMTLIRPVQSALLPQLARSPDELTAANVVVSTFYSSVVLVGPALSGALLGLGGAGLVFASFAGVLLLGAVLVVRLEPRPAPAPSDMHPLREAAAGFAAVARERDQRLVVGLLAGQEMIAGAFDVLLVVIALGLLGLPPSGAGYLAAALGAGGLLGGLWAVGLVGRRHLAAALAFSMLVYGLGTAALAFTGVPIVTAAFLVLAGSGYARADMAGRILLQRVVPDRILARVFGVLEGVNQAALAAGAALAPLLVAALGLRGGVLAAGLLLPAAIALLAARIRAVDRAAKVPEREIELLRTLDLFAPLEPATLEGVASRLVPVSAAAGQMVIREGDVGDRFYVVADGELEVSRNGQVVARLGPGKYFGEIALLRDVPRTATVKAAGPTKLLALERVDFLEAVTGHPLSHEAAHAAIRQRISDL